MFFRSEDGNYIWCLSVKQKNYVVVIELLFWCFEGLFWYECFEICVNLYMFFVDNFSFFQDYFVFMMNFMLNVWVFDEKWKQDVWGL